MRVEHIAIWCSDIEIMRAFYVAYFAAESNDIYINARGFRSYFLSFGGGDCRIELMQRADILDSASSRGFALGLAHLAIEVGTEADVLALTERLRTDGYTIASEPRTTGDGYFESAVLDPEENYIEITARK